MTKAITSTAAMQLVEQGKFTLDDPVEKYLPEMAKLPVFDSFDAKTGNYHLHMTSKPITVRHVLTHSSGLGLSVHERNLARFQAARGRDLSRWPACCSRPGEKWWYGTSTDIVGRLVRNSRARSWKIISASTSLLSAQDDGHLLQCAGAERRHASSRRSSATVSAWMRAIVKQAQQPGLTIAQPIGGGGLASTASDYGRFVRMLLNGGELDGARVLKAETVALMGQNHIGNVSVPAPGVGATAQPRLHLRGRRPRQVWPWFPDHDRPRTRQALGREPELGRHQQHLFLGRSEPRHRRRDPDAVPAILPIPRRSRSTTPSSVPPTSLRTACEEIGRGRRRRRVRTSG